MLRANRQVSRIEENELGLFSISVLVRADINIETSEIRMAEPRRLQSLNTISAGRSNFNIEAREIRMSGSISFQGFNIISADRITISNQSIFNTRTADRTLANQQETDTEIADSSSESPDRLMFEVAEGEVHAEGIIVTGEMIIMRV